MISQIILNLYELDKLPICVTNNLLVPNVVVFTNRHGKIINKQHISDPIFLPKGAYKAVIGPLLFL
jgi:hypothetical protein